MCLNVMVHASNSNSSDAVAGGPGVRCSSLGYIVEIKWQLQRPPKKKQHKETQKPAVLMQFLEPTESVGMEQGLSMI